VRPRRAARLLVVLLAWTTFAFAGVYLSSLVVPALLCVALAALVLPPKGGSHENHTVSGGSRDHQPVVWLLYD
jgi:hypothetical protein